MDASEKLLDIEKRIKKYNPSHYTCLVNIEGFNRPLLLSASKAFDRKIKIYDYLHGVNNIAVIRYSLNGNHLFISDIEVNADYQRHGIGSLLAQLAITHGDKLGADLVYGHLFPTSNIKGASSRGYKAEVKALSQFFESVGCSIKDLYNGSTKAFTQKWKSGDKINNATPNVKIITESIAENELQTAKTAHRSEVDITTVNYF